MQQNQELQIYKKSVSLSKINYLCNQTLDKRTFNTFSSTTKRKKNEKKSIWCATIDGSTLSFTFYTCSLMLQGGGFIASCADDYCLHAVRSGTLFPSMGKKRKPKKEGLLHHHIRCLGVFLTLRHASIPFIRHNRLCYGCLF